MADQLNLYNEALTEHLGERALATLTEERGPRRQLDGVWDRNFIRAVLEEGQWNWATRTMKVEPEDSYEPSFGRQFQFVKPDDLARITYICRDEFFRYPLREYEDEANFWFSDYNEIFIRYVSDDITLGGDLANWPESFARFAAGKLALRATALITQNKINKKELEKTVKALRVDARSIDAMKDPSRTLPSGRWTTSRDGSRRGQDSRHSARGPA